MNQPNWRRFKVTKDVCDISYYCMRARKKDKVAHAFGINKEKIIEKFV